jgi:membrane-associated phospholipid phosphatase
MPRRSALALLGAAAGVALLALTWLAAFHIGLVERVDQSIFSGFSGLGQRPHVGTIATFIAHLCNPNPYVYLAAVPVLIAIARRRVGLTTAVCAILLGANATTELLKPVLAHPRAASLFGGVAPVQAGSWPSGHATAAMSLALCMVLAVPARLRPAMATLGAVFAVAVSYSFLSLQWHYPSDVIGGFLVAGIWALLGIGAVYFADAQRRPAADTETRPRISVREALAPPALTLIGALVVALLIALARPHEVVAYARVHHAFMFGAAGIAGLALALATGLSLALRR